MVASGYDIGADVIIGFFVLALVLGVLMTLPIGGADMPVVISLYNAFTGLAVAFEGFVLRQRGADHRRHGGRRRRHAADAADGQGDEPLDRQRAVLRLRRHRRRGAGGTEVSGSMKPIEAGDVGVMMAFAQKVIDRARLRHGGGAGAAQGLGAEPAADRARRAR